SQGVREGAADPPDRRHHCAFPAAHRRALTHRPDLRHALGSSEEPLVDWKRSQAIFSIPRLRCRRQKAWFLPPAGSRSYARAGSEEPRASGAVYVAIAKVLETSDDGNDEHGGDDTQHHERRPGESKALARGGDDYGFHGRLLSHPTRSGVGVLLGATATWR